MKYTLTQLINEAPDGKYKIETYLPVWNDIQVKLKTTFSGGKSIKFVTVPQYGDGPQHKTGQAVPMCGVVTNNKTTYVQIEEI